jgi:hypothetical protein
VIALLLLTVALTFPLPAACLYGPLADRVTDRRIARRRAAAARQPIRIAEWTGHTWAEVRPGGAW